MRKNLAALLVAASSLAGASTAIAGAGIVNTSVTPLAPNVSYSVAGARPMLAYIGYLVTVSSDPANTNTINNVVFTGTASATDAAEKPEFLSAEGASCTTTNADRTAISCSLGQLRAGQTYPAFAVFFKSPVKVVNGTADAPGTDFALFSGITYYAEGTGGLENSIPQNSTTAWNAAIVTLGTTSPTTIKSSVPRSGGNFFTGSGISTGDDPFATSVTVPAATTFTAQATIAENTFTTVVSGSTTLACSSFSPCYQSKVTLPGAFSFLQIVLRQDASTINPGVKIGNVLIWYEGSGGAGDSYRGYIGLCPTPTTPVAGQPCIASFKHYKNRSVPGWTTALDGDFEWTIIANENGGYTVGL